MNLITTIIITSVVILLLLLVTLFTHSVSIFCVADSNFAMSSTTDINTGVLHRVYNVSAAGSLLQPVQRLGF